MQSWYGKRCSLAAMVLAFTWGACFGWPTVGQEPAPPPTVQPPATESPAAESPETQPPTSPAAEGEEKVDQILVDVGIYVNQVHSVSLRDNQFTVDFYVWFRWDGHDEYTPLENFELISGQIDSKSNEYVDKIDEDGKLRNYATCRVVATVTQFWDVRRFPLDDHVLQISLEDADHEEHKVKFVPDGENSRTSPRVQVPGWKVLAAQPEISSQRYESNYGDTSLPTSAASVYSRFSWNIPVVREGWGYFAKLFCGLFIATSISFLVFFIKPTEVDPRFGLGVGAIFAAVASEYVVTSTLPDTNLVTMADWLHILAFIFIFLGIAQSVYSLKLYSSEDEAKQEQSRKLDWYSFWGLFILYAALTVSAVIFT